MRASPFFSDVLLQGQTLSFHKHPKALAVHGCTPKTVGCNLTGAHTQGLQRCDDTMGLQCIADICVLLQMQRTGNQENPSGIFKPPAGTSCVRVEDESSA